VSELDPEQHRRQIQQALADRRWADAAELFRSWTQRFPEHADGWYGLAQCLRRTGNPGDALDSARRAHQLSPTEPKHLELLRRIETALPPEPEATLVEDHAEAGTTPPTLADEGDAAEAVRDPHTPAATLVEGTAEAAQGVGATLVEERRPSEPEAGAGPASAEPDVTEVDHEPAIEPTAVDDGGATLLDAPAVDAEKTAPPTQMGAWARGSVVEGRYEVRGSTRGGMGVVYFVHDRELGLDIAVKTPLAKALATDAGRQRFLREAEAWVALGLHPNICSAYYVREIDGVPRLFIEYVDGGDLGEWLKKNRDAPLAERLDFAIQIAAGMAHSHSVVWHDDEGQEHRGLVHRDLKPANVLLGSDGRARVTDFGLVGRGVGGEADAMPADEPPSPADEQPAPEMTAGGGSRTGSIWSTMTVAGRVLGSPVYMAPEQWAGAHFAGAAADIYAFGSILYELVCFRRPFILDPKYRDADSRALITLWKEIHCNQAPENPRSLQPGLDNELAEIMLECLAKDPEQRPASFVDLGRILREVYGRVSGRDYPRPAAAAGALLADSLNNRGVSFACLGQERRAERAWQDALATDPQHAQAGFNLALLQWQRRGATDEELTRRMAELRRSDGGDWRRGLLAARMLLALGSSTDALASLESAAQASGNAPEAVRELSFALCAAAAENNDPELWRRAAALPSEAGSGLRGDPAFLVSSALAAHRIGEETTSHRLWAAVRRLLPKAPADLEACAAGMLPGCRKIRHTDPPLGRITSMALDPGGTTAVFGTETGALAVLNPETGELRTLRGQGGRIRCTAVAPQSDLALSFEDNQPVTSWDLATGATRNLQPHTGYLNALVISRDGRLAAAASSAGHLVVWDLSTAQRTSVVETHTGFAAGVALSADGRTAVSGGADGNLVVVGLEDDRVIGTLAAHAEGVTAVALSEDGRLALTGGTDGICRIWDLDQQAELASLAGHAGPISFAAFNHDCTRALTGSADQTLRQWELPSGRALASDRVGGPIGAGSASNDWTTVIAAHGNAMSQYTMLEPPEYQPAWAVAHLVSSVEAEERDRQFRDLLDRSHSLVEAGDLATARMVVDQARAIPGYERAPESLEALAEVDSLYPRAGLADAWEEQLLRGHGDAVTGIAVATLTNQVVSCGRDRKLLRWDWAQGTIDSEIRSQSIPQAAAMIGDRAAVATADLDNTIRVWDLDGAETLLELEGHETRICDIAGEPLGRWLLSADHDGAVRLWDADTGACRHQLSGHLGGVSSCALHPDGRRAATGGDDGTLLIWSLFSGRSIGGLEGHTAAVHHLTWSAEGRYLVSTGDDASRVWELPSGRCLRTIELEGATPTCSAMSPDSRFAAIGESGGAVSLWQLRDRLRLRVFEGHTGSVTAVSFTRDGRRLISSGEDGTLRVWYLEWQPEARTIVEWDRAAQPHLELFVAQHTPIDGGPPRWTDTDLRRLISDLRHRGLGWIRPDGIRTRLEALVREGVVRPRTRSSEALRQARAATPLARASRRKFFFRLFGATAAAVPLLLVANIVWSYRQLHLDSRAARELRAENLTVLLAPAATTRRAPCDRSKLAMYVEDFTGPTDSLADWSAASHCLAELADPRSVAPLLDVVRQPKDRPPPITGIQIGADRKQVLDQVRRAMSGGLDTDDAVQSLLARMGSPVVPTLVEFLDEPDPEVRNAAAGALVLAGTDDSIRALVARAQDPNERVRLAVARQVANLAISDKLELAEAFKLAELMARDGDPSVRLAIAERLGIFDGARPRALARRLAEDSDPQVAGAALLHIY
jgi:WD40 repeat protein/serine/threonine protein kinase